MGNMRNEYTVFIGIDSNGEAVYGEVTFGRMERVENEFVKKGYFSVCFTSASMEVYNDDILEERLADKLDGYGDEIVGDILKRNPNITYNELPEFILRHDGREAVLDVDTFLPEFTLENGDDVAFTFSSVGQYDTRNEFLDESNNLKEGAQLLVPIEFYIKLNNLWDRYHLSEYENLSESQLAELKAFEEEFYKVADKANEEMEQFLKDYVNECVKEYDTEIAY